MEGPVRTATPEEMRAAIGTELGSSEWLTLDQTLITQFARLTGDEYFIHVNPERARRETAFGGTIAHGFLTLSLVSQMAYQVCPFVAGSTSMVNYGFNRLRFVAPVPSGASVRGRFKLKSFEAEAARWQSVYDLTVEIEGGAKPAIVAEWLNAGFF